MANYSRRFFTIIMMEKIPIKIPISEAYLGRVINALAKPIDGQGEIYFIFY